MIRGFVVDKADRIVEVVQEAQVEQLLKIWSEYYVTGIPNYFTQCLE